MSMSESHRHEAKEIRRLRDSLNMTFGAIATSLQMSETTVRRRYRAAILMEAADETEEDALTDFPAAPELEIEVQGPFIPEDKETPERFKPLVYMGDAMVTCDYHIPLHDPSLINTMINCARKNEIKHLIIGGDYWNLDSVSSYLPHQPEAALDVERKDGNTIMKTLLETFETVDFIWGNHDFRLSKKLGFKKSFEECMRWMFSPLSEEEYSRIRVSELDHMDFYPEPDGLGKKYRICHPANFSSVPLTVGRKLAVKYGCSIITAHSHHCAIGAAPNGVDLVLEGGGFFAKDRTEYIQRTTSHHEWVQGFTMFKDGLPTVISPTIGNDVNYRKEVATYV